MIEHRLPFDDLWLSDDDIPLMSLDRLEDIRRSSIGCLPLDPLLIMETNLIDLLPHPQGGDLFFCDIHSHLLFLFGGGSLALLEGLIDTLTILMSPRKVVEQILEGKNPIALEYSNVPIGGFE